MVLVDTYLTSFQKKVLDIITHVPAGKVTTYQEIARALHHPRAARAVGNALNKNPYLVTVPCHRVVTSDGRVGGYREGIEQKINLLSQEGIVVSNGKVDNFIQKLFSLSMYAS